MILSRLAAAALAAGLIAAPALAQQPGAKAKDSPLTGLGSNSKEPIKVDADRLEVFDRENRAVYTGNVVAVQGDTTMRCTTLTIFFERQRGADGAVQRTAAPAGGDQNDAIKRIECGGPVTVVSKTQVATGDQAVYDRAGGRVIMTGNVALSDGPNVTRGERLVYDVNAGKANIESAPNGGRVRGLFVPGSQDASGAAKPGEAKAGDAKPAKPAASRPATN
ncbi:LptA/OstA family protein [Salinarimonas soli]|uniref:Organic solvent tolerance protein OstA n=1 Tax=Salinarimonas soli TaxID=1638099 RepID=A0A5B2V9Z0_9HYPH|nr:LptA/OstA family protein [Salinarimonas soli]KAA2235831.1 organic solvent tolerance protein OstA [Salinarimonas soli]